MDQKCLGYIIVTDHLPADGITDISDRLQSLIDANPNRTLFFPDGTYLLEKPICTPAHPKRSVDLQVSNFACIRASKNWHSNEAMIKLGAKDPANDIWTPGSNYGISGGIVDGAGTANAISIDGGRETYIRNINIKNAHIGIHIKHGANNGSSDADIFGINITGNGAPDSIGVLLEGYDNTLTNMRIANVFTGVEVHSGGNMLRNIHPLFIINSGTVDRYRESAGFRIIHGMNWFDYCYSDQFAVGFDTTGGGIFKNCFCWWYSDKEEMHCAFRCEGPFCGSIDNFVIGGAQHPEHPNEFMTQMNIGESGSVINIVNITQNGVPTRIM